MRSASSSRVRPAIGGRAVSRGAGRGAERALRWVAAGAAAAMAVAALTPAAVADPLDDGAAAPGAGLTRTGTGYAIASESAYASAAAEAVLRKPRATAVDAVVAAVLDIGVTKPEACGLGGGGFLVRRGADGDVTTIDFREVAPSVPYSKDDRWPPHLSLAGAPTKDGTGHAAVGVPGTLAGLVEMHRRWGKVPWNELFDHAIRDARYGFRAGRDLAGSSVERGRDMLAFEDTHRTFGAVVEGALVVQEDLARTLERLRDASDPFAEFYVSGETALKIQDEMLHGVSKRGTDRYGDYTKWADGDLEGYRARVREPVVSRFGEYEVYGMGAPSSGGIAVAQILGMLRDDRLPHDVMTSIDSRASWTTLLAEVERLAFADRNTWIGDPRSVDVPTEAMIDAEYLQQRRDMVDVKLVRDAYPPGQFEGYAQPPTVGTASTGTNTTHLSIVLQNGEAVSLTCTIEQALGSVVTAAGTGILLNNELTDFNAPAADPAAANALRPGNRPRSSMSPTIVIHDGQPVLAVGGRGGETIISGVAQVLLGVLAHDRGITDALADGRVKAYLPDPARGPRALQVEQVPMSQDLDLKSELKARGHDPVQFRSYFPFPVLSAVQVRGTELIAASDPRGERGSRAGGAT